jgi:PRC-barrel domain
MEHTSDSSRLRYLDADDLDDSAVSFGDLDVCGTDGHKLGDLDGFIVDAHSGRVYYAVVDSGGWFTSRRFLLPIGHATLGRDHRSMQVDVSKEALKQLPQFDSDRFRDFADDELRAFEQRTTAACCPEDAQAAETGSGYEVLRHYRQPEWWKSDYHRAENHEPSFRQPPDDDVRVETSSVPSDPVRPAQPGDVLGLASVGTSTDDERSKDEDR